MNIIEKKYFNDNNYYRYMYKYMIYKIITKQ